MLPVTDHLYDVLLGLPHVGRLAILCRSRSAYIVGGAVRDALLGLSVKDLDIILPDDPTDLAMSFARQTGGSWFWLDKERRHSRVVFNTEENTPDFDFAPFRAPTLGQDLLDRDFTVNAIAISLKTDHEDGQLVDPLCGLDDLQNKVLRMVGNRALASDPLRIIKGIRHATVLDLEPEEETLRSMHREVTGLYHVAEERIRREIWGILASQNASRGLRLLSSSLVGNYLFSNEYSSQCEKLVAHIETCRAAWRSLSPGFPNLEGWLADEVEQGLHRETLILWTFMLSQIDHSLPCKLAEEWMLSRKAQANIRGLASIGEESVAELGRVYHNQRAFAWWSYKIHIDPKILMLALAALGAEKHKPLIASWLPLVDLLPGEKPDDFVNGLWLRSNLGLQDGPEMTQALLLVREAEITGEVRSEEDARKLLCHHYKNID